MGVFSMHLWHVKEFAGQCWPFGPPWHCPSPPGCLVLPSHYTHTKGLCWQACHSAVKPCAYPIIPRPSESLKTLLGLIKKGCQKSPMCALVHVYFSKHQFFPLYAPTMQTNNFQCHWVVIYHFSYLCRWQLAPWPTVSQVAAQMGCSPTKQAKWDRRNRRTREALREWTMCAGVCW